MVKWAIEILFTFPLPAIALCDVPSTAKKSTNNEEKAEKKCNLNVSREFLCPKSCGIERFGAVADGQFNNTKWNVNRIFPNLCIFNLSLKPKDEIYFMSYRDDVSLLISSLHIFIFSIFYYTFFLYRICWII